MSDVTDTSPVEVTSEFGKDGQGIAKRWITELNNAEKEFEDWQKRVDQITDRYRDKSTNIDMTTRPRRFNVLWSNIQTFKPVLYNRTPLPVVERRFSDKDPVARTGGMIMERALMTEHGLSDFDQNMNEVLLDYLLGARGQAWVGYEFETGDVPVSDAPPGEDGQLPKVQDVTEQSAPARYLNRKDFLHSPARTWDEVRWVAKRAYMTRDELKARFGDEIGAKIPLDYEPTGIVQDIKDSKEYDLFKKAMIWEIWNKPTKEVIWISRGYVHDALDKKPAPLKLRNFFPCPRPMYGTLINETLVPIPDYDEYRDQAEQIDELTARIALVTKAVRVAGAYAGVSKDSISQILDGASDNMLIPVDSWVAFKDSGGLKGMIDWLPMEQIVTVLKSLLEIRAQLLNDLYQITGISDIVRGQGAASESATGQRLKAQYAGLRISDRQKEIKRFIRDVVRIQAEIMADKFTPQVLAGMSGIANAQGADLEQLTQVFALLRNDRFRDWKIDVETDESQMRDPEMEKQSAIEFITAFGAFLERAVPLAASAPSLTPVIGETTMFLLRKFSVARSLESAFEQSLPALQDQAQQQNQLQKEAQQKSVQQMGQEGGPQENPQAEMLKAQVEAEKGKNEIQAGQQQMAIERERFGLEKAKAGQEMQIDKLKAGIDLKKSQQQMGIEQMKAQVGQVKSFAEMQQAQQAAKIRNAQAMMPKGAPK